jgi:hypothetical protein
MKSRFATALSPAKCLAPRKTTPFLRLSRAFSTLTNSHCFCTKIVQITPLLPILTDTPLASPLDSIPTEKQAEGALFPGPCVFSAHSFHSSGKSETSSPFYSGTSTLFANTQIQGTYTPPSRKTAVFIRQSTTPMEPSERLSPITHSRITRHGSPEHESTPFRHFARRSLCPKKPYLQAHHLMAKRTRTVVLSRVYTCSSLGLGRPNSCNPLRQNF